MHLVLLTARDPLRAGDGAHPARTAADFAADGNDITLVLLEDAVTLTRPAHRDAGELAAAVAAGATVLAEEEALSRRAVTDLADGVKPTGLDEIVDLLMERSDRQAWV